MQPLTPSLTPLQRYQHDMQHNGFQADPAQLQAIEQLNDRYHQLLASSLQQGSWIKRMGQRLQRRPNSVPGLYLWGGVGRGKTYLMDIFFEALPFEAKLRMHFHRFMQMIHQRMKAYPGHKNPLQRVADDLARQYRVICFDEFFVSDIGDAMILANVLQALFQRQMTLITTSNIQPDGLYRDGLQRDRFLPAIALLQQHTWVLNVDGGTDYRLRQLQQVSLYHCPLNAATQAALQHSLDRLIPPALPVQQQQPLTVLGRKIHSQRWCEDIVWFEFADLCHGPRSQNDYIELARCFHTVIISQIPQMSAQQDDCARRFINLIDEFYDRNVKLILSAQVPLAALYTGTRLAFEFERTRSRLIEMQTQDYLAREHKA